MPNERCLDHDKCFEKVSNNLDDIKTGVEEINIRLEAGSGNFRLLEHRLTILERIVFALVSATGLIIVGALLRLILKS